LRYLAQRPLAPVDVPIAGNKCIVATWLVAVKEFAWLAPLQVIILTCTLFPDMAHPFAVQN
jgi:hypothetical protein